MNKLKGKIVDIKTSQNLSIASVSVADSIVMKAIVIETPDSVDYLKIGNSVTMLFKETEVIMGTNSEIPISLQNRFPGKILSVDKGDLLSKVVLDTAAGNVISIISSNAVEQLELKAGIDATAFVKLNEVMISVQ